MWCGGERRGTSGTAARSHGVVGAWVGLRSCARSGTRGACEGVDVGEECTILRPPQWGCR